MHLETLHFLDDFYNAVYSIKDDKLIDISRDVDFNFGEKKKGKYHRYKKILSEDNAIEYINKLEECKKRTHSILNFSLFPKTGAMNTAKEWSEDRVDAFLYYLNELIKEINKIGVEEVYKEFDQLIIRNQEVPSKYRLLKSFVGNATHKKKMETKYNLIKYLSRYKDIYCYCREWYLLYDDTNNDKIQKYIDDTILCEKSITVISTAEDVKRYMDIAAYFWDIRKKHYINAGKDEKELQRVDKEIAKYDI